MKVNDKNWRTIWLDEADPTTVCAIDQRLLPHELKVVRLKTLQSVIDAIRDMLVRGAPLIGVTAAYGVYLGALEAPHDDRFRKHLDRTCKRLLETRPTAVNLAWAIEKQQAISRRSENPQQVVDELRKGADEITQQEIEISKALGEHGLQIIKDLAARMDRQHVAVLTHCNAGWLATVEWGTALSPVYHAFDDNIPVHVFVDETRPRNQGASLTAWELGQHGVPYTLITDNAGGHLMQNGMVDMVIVGADRIARNGDVANKIGTYLKALAAKANGVPFYVAAPSSSIDWNLDSGKQIPIEQRNQDEVRFVHGLSETGVPSKVLICPPDACAANYGFDVTPSELITGIITERGICAANEESLLRLFPEQRRVPVH